MRVATNGIEWRILAILWQRKGHYGLILATRNMRTVNLIARELYM